MNKYLLQLVFVLVLSGLIVQGCKKEDGNSGSGGNNGVLVKYDTTSYAMELGDFPPPVIPEDNRLTVQKVRLGRMLFYEKKLSRNNTQSCASCHRQENAFTDTNRFSTGVEGLPGKRQAMAIFNLAWNNNEFFWDGRAHMLRDQALMPIQDPLEMNETLENVISKLTNESLYKNQFIRAFGSPEITAEKISLAIEQFMMSIVSNDSKYDRYLRGETNLTTQELRGKWLFENEYYETFPDISGGDCMHCHSGFNFANDRYFNNGLDTESEISDIGREKVTNNPEHRAAFRNTSLRNIALTPPYMHDGRFTTLEEVVDHYNDGIKLSSSVAPEIKRTVNTGLRLTEEDKAALVAFLKTLTDNTLINNPEYSDPFQ